MSLLSDRDLYLFNEGSHIRLYDHLGCHLAEHRDQSGAWFSVWAPDAESVSVIGSFNGWDPQSDLLTAVAQSGIWEGFIPGVRQGDTYKFHITSRFRGY
jgi:1,4-alpha-glucan branching enzyme